MASVRLWHALLRRAGRTPTLTGLPGHCRPLVTRTLTGLLGPAARPPPDRAGGQQPPPPGLTLRPPGVRLTHQWGSRDSVGRPQAQPWPAAAVAAEAADAVDAGAAGRCVRVRWRDGSESLFPFVWLRDNCQCPACFLAHPTFARALVLRDLDVDATVRECRVSEDGSEVTLTWVGGHQSRFAADWLLARSFRPEEQRQRLAEHALERRHWDARMADSLPHADFQQVLDSERTRLEMLVALERYGLVVVKNCGQQRGQVLRLVETLGYARTTHYQTVFEVRTKLDPVNISYTTKRLNMHTDLPYYEQQPQVQLLHVLRQHTGGGGRTEFTDAVHVANELRRRRPEAFRVLADTPVDWANVTLSQETGRSHHKLHRAPVLQVDAGDRVLAVRFSQAQRDSHFGAALDDVQRWYRAASLFNEMLNRAEFKVSFLPESGDMLVFDNTRLVHGREDFRRPERAGQRCLEGAYVGLDDVRDHRRTLQQRLGDNQYGL